MKKNKRVIDPERGAAEPKGFSLIELMVVVAIIGFLSAIGLAVYADVQSKGRDAKRKGDIDSIAKVLEIHRTDANNYVPLQTDWFGSSAGLPTADPKGYRYCINSNSTGTSIDNATVDTWDDNKECVIYSNVAADSTPASSDTTWKVCTLLDNGTNVYCRYSVQ